MEKFGKMPIELKGILVIGFIVVLFIMGANVSINGDREEATYTLTQGKDMYYSKHRPVFSDDHRCAKFNDPEIIVCGEFVVKELSEK